MKHGETDASVSVGLVGDYSPRVRAHVAIPRALALAAPAGVGVKAEWVPTGTLGGDVGPRLTGFDALWCVPASPYASMEGALSAIRFAREGGVPFLGTCGGFQHALIEYARGELGLAEADHAESNPEATMPLVAPLSCSLVGARGKIALAPGSRVRAVYGTDETTEEYHCNFGFNQQYRVLLADGALRVTGVDEAGEVRVVELDGHPFFVATLFQPELSALSGVKHPLVEAFARAASRRASGRRSRSRDKESTTNVPTKSGHDGLLKTVR